MTNIDATVAELHARRLEPDDDPGREVQQCPGCSEMIHTRDQVFAVPTLGIVCHDDPLCIHDSWVAWCEHENYTIVTGFINEVLHDS